MVKIFYFNICAILLGSESMAQKPVVSTADMKVLRKKRRFSPVADQELFS
jgi:hypothetical protein